MINERNHDAAVLKWLPGAFRGAQKPLIVTAVASPAMKTENYQLSFQLITVSRSEPLCVFMLEI